MKLDGHHANMSISDGTTREEDLIPTFVRFLANFEHKKITSYIDEDLLPETQAAIYCWLIGEEVELHTDKAQEEISWFLNEDLFDKLNEIAPEGCYFGSHSGDGAAYGFWQVEEI